MGFSLITMGFPPGAMSPTPPLVGGWLSVVKHRSSSELKSSNVSAPASIILYSLLQLEITVSPVIGSALLYITEIGLTGPSA